MCILSICEPKALAHIAVYGTRMHISKLLMAPIHNSLIVHVALTWYCDYVPDVSTPASLIYLGL